VVVGDGSDNRVQHPIDRLSAVGQAARPAGMMAGRVSLFSQRLGIAYFSFGGVML
jgi:hypothetical protein